MTTDRHRRIWPHEVPETSTPRLTLKFVDDDGVTPIPGASMTDVRLTVYDDDTGTIIRADVDIKAQVDVNGAMDLTLLDTDTTLVGAGPTETHVALIEFEWDSGTKRDFVEIVFTVRNLSQVP